MAGSDTKKTSGAVRPGTENLKKIDSTEKARELGKKGGIASGKAKREKKALRELALAILDAEPEKVNAYMKKKLTNLGISEEVVNNRLQMMASIADNAIHGDLKAAEKLLDIAGEHVSRQGIEVSSSGKLDSLVASIDAVKKGKDGAK